MAATFYGFIVHSIVIVSIAAYQLDPLELMAEVSPGTIMPLVLRIASIILQIHMGYDFWSLSIFLVLLFFAVEFTVMLAVN